MLRQEVEDGQASLANPQFRADVLAGLDRRPRAIPARWFYDRRGSELFEKITDLPEYYPTRSETAVLGAIGGELRERIGPGRAVVEFGSGSSTKTPLVLEAIEPSAYVPIDISGDFLRESSKALSTRFPNLLVLPFEADFTRPLALPRTIAAAPKLGFFPGSTIGNLIPHAAVDLLRAMRSSLGEGAMLLIGMDRIKSADVLVPAYDDAQGVTAAFNLNLLERINRELDGDIPVDAFRHRAIWNDDRARIEMHLEATRDVDFTVDGRKFSICAGETIHTENSHKYGPRDARILLRAGGWTPIQMWMDADEKFAVYLAEAQAERPAP
ncbi:L-histidine N(alpha)-methyltransferase [Sphingomonas sp. SUN019]|uniref:L-histidine N(alpha)-methyltransferase n=1 Tax=Sphingomonas sp. SUN019 TaxID=2937788 RepID=UPI002164BD4A|nr:L-histidine N(alpha)-methyltransferase [Sphingomonas sp. SUN019]UVO50790.1 L-histidine N(alpha)-methyltransferase [Sphingomonas sp. SUN019]